MVLGHVGLFLLLPGAHGYVTEQQMMRARFSLLSGIFLASLFAAPSFAQQGGGSHLSYYTYYKSESGETISGLAAKFGLAESSLVRMNPYLTQYGSELPLGTLVCVPKEKVKDEPVVAKASGKPKADSKAPASSAKKAAKPKKKADSEAKPKAETEWPDEDEWDKLADLATKGAPPPPERSIMVIEAPPSKLIRSNGEVVLIPAAKPRVQPKPKKVEDNSRGQLSSRKGKAIHNVIMTGRSFMGVPYVWGGEDPSGFDCSGFIQYVYAKHGISLPRTADIQFNVGKVIKFGDEKPGDLVFFETYCPGPSHVGIYLGRDYFLHASSSRGVTVDRLSSDFFGPRYLGAKRNF